MTNRLVNRLFVGVAAGFLLVGCDSQVVTPSAPRAPTTADQVVIYPKQPDKYEDLGTVTVPIGGRVRMDERGDATFGIEELKKQAAALGANGLLLDEKKVPSDMRATCAYKGTFYQIPVTHNPKAAKALAIWVYNPSK